MADKTVIYSIIGVVGIGVAIFAVSRIVESVVQSGRLKPVSSNPEKKESGTMVSNAEQFAKNIENQKWNERRIQEQREAESKKAKGQQSTTDAYVAARIAEMNARNAQPLPPAANPQPGPSKVNIPKVDGLGQNGGHNPLYQKQSGDPQTVSMPGTMYNIVMQN